MTDNYKALIEELHALQPPFSYSKSLGGRSARAVEALMAENEKLRESYRIMHGFAEERAAERDALQQQLDKVRAALTDPPLRPATERVIKAVRLINHPDWDGDKTDE